MDEGDQVTCVYCPSTDVPNNSEMCLDCIEEIRSTRKQTVSKPRGLFESPQDKRDEQIAKWKAPQSKTESLSESVEEDPEWVDSAIYVRKKKKKKDDSFEAQLERRKKLEDQLLAASKPKSSHSPEVRRWEAAQNYLDAHPTSHGKDRTHIFLPFYPASEKGISETKMKKGLGSDGRGGDYHNLEQRHLGSLGLTEEDLSTERGKEFIDKVYHPHFLPGPICRLLDRTNLPPRRFWLRENVGPMGPGTKPADSLAPHKRISFELYLDLHCIQKRPWPLELWCTHIQFGGAIFDVLRKGGALGRVAGDYLLNMNSGPISERDVQGFINNVLDLSIADFGLEMLIDIEKKTLEILEKMWNFCDYEEYEEGDPNLLQKFIEAYCLASYNNEPTVFWKLDTKKQISSLGT
ncbi:MAG: hypothetical protein VYA86_03185 [Candidatus Thermoplasmatota archaeon]|nr:hypothetical protein [Candidatus Thermoplasmatota archaeon]